MGLGDDWDNNPPSCRRQLGLPTLRRDGADVGRSLCVPVSLQAESSASHLQRVGVAFEGVSNMFMLDFLSFKKENILVRHF